MLACLVVCRSSRSTGVIVQPTCKGQSKNRAGEFSTKFFEVSMQDREPEDSVRVVLRRRLDAPKRRVIYHQHLVTEFSPLSHFPGAATTVAMGPSPGPSHCLDAVTLPTVL